MSTPITNRYDFVFLFDVKNGNPNGDPDAGNLPRLDPETSHGLVTDVCLKRKIRNFVQMAKEDEPGFNIYVQEKSVLNQQNQQAYDALDIKSEKGKLPKDKEKAQQLTDWMCANFFDIRSFGAVMTTGVNCGQVRGPVQLAFAESVNRILPLEVSITRMAVTTEAEAEKQSGDNRTMGRKAIVPYGLYRAHGYISAKLAEKTGFSEDDLQLLWQALKMMFEHDRSAARGEMAARGLIAFKHDSAMGNAPAHELFDLVKVEATQQPVRSFADYAVTVDHHNCPDGVEIQTLLGKFDRASEAA